MTKWHPPLRIEPFPSESLGGFLIRYCDVNGWPSFRHFVNLLGVRQREVQYQTGDLRDIESRLGLDTDTLPSAGSRHGEQLASVGGHTFSRRYFQPQRRICPLCIAETGYQRTYWEFNFLTRCHLHGLAFQSSCGCGKPFTWSDPSLRFCADCMVAESSVSATPAVPGSPFQDWCLKALGVLTAGASVSNLDGTSITEAIALLTGIGLLEVQGFGEHRPADDGSGEYYRELGFEIVAGGRLHEVIEETVSQYRRLKETSCPRIPADALGWFGTLLLYHCGPSPSPLERALTQALSAALGYPVDDLARSDYVPVKQIAGLTAMAEARILDVLSHMGADGACRVVTGDETVVPTSLVYDLRRALGEWT